MSYDQFLDRELERHARRAEDDIIADSLICDRAIQLGANATELLAWCADHDVLLVEMAPAWIREGIVGWLLNSPVLSDDVAAGIKADRLQTQEDIAAARHDARLA